MNHSNSKYFCLLKGDWQKRFFELVEMFQISLHEKFAIGVPEVQNDYFNRVIVYGMAQDGPSPEQVTPEITDEEIFDSFYGHPAFEMVQQSNENNRVEFEKTPVNFFDQILSYN